MMSQYILLFIWVGVIQATTVFVTRQYGAWVCNDSNNHKLPLSSWFGLFIMIIKYCCCNFVYSLCSFFGFNNNKDQLAISAWKDIFKLFCAVNLVLSYTLHFARNSGLNSNILNNLLITSVLIFHTQNCLLLQVLNERA